MLVLRDRDEIGCRVMIEIDGSQGEGGGQILRSALALSIMTGKSMCIDNIRAGRSKPGLRAQHLMSLDAAVRISDAAVTGAQPGSSSVTFQPDAIRAGEYHFQISTAGATSLVLQTIYLPLSFANVPSSVRIVGGTHVRWSPCFHYLDWQWGEQIARNGYQVELFLERAGFFPQGGGRIQAGIYPVEEISPLCLMERGELRKIRGVSIACNLPKHISERQRRRAIDRLKHLECELEIDIEDMPSNNKGSLLCLLAEFENSRACYFGLGVRGLPAERVADRAVDQLLDFIKGDGCVDQYLADQLLLPLTFAADRSEFRTSKITRHLATNANVIQAFTSARIELVGDIGESGVVRIHPPG
jgi:RNA 3'-terminal phosphate cyclase (ATP)